MADDYIPWWVPAEHATRGGPVPVESAKPEPESAPEPAPDAPIAPPDPDVP